MHSYLVRDDALEFGASLGNAHCWLTTHGHGSIQDVFSTDLGMTIANTIAVRYGGVDHHLLRASAQSVTTDPGAADVQLRPVAPGTIELHPAYQRHSFALPENLEVQQTVFVPVATGDDPAVAYCQVAIANSGVAARTVRVFAFGRLCGALGQDLTARYDAELRALVVANRNRPGAVRIFGCTCPVTAYETSHDFGRSYDVLHAIQLNNDISAEGDVLAALQVDLDLAPGQMRTLAFVLAFALAGESDAVATYQGAQDVDAALSGTIDYLTRITSIAEVLTPYKTINIGALWSKVNMLRVMAHYPQGLAFTNEPGVSSAVVGRDAAWFVYGNDHFRPEFSQALLDAFAARQYSDGHIPEVYDAVTNRIDDYGLNINDDTPLFILAVNHHFRATGDLKWLGGIYPAVAAAARYIVAQEDDRGLVFCSAKDPRGNVWAIAGWRNVIPDYTLNGAVTEINAECAAALRAAGHLAQNLGQPAAEAEEFFAAAANLRTAMDTHLLNPQNGMYYLNIDADGTAHTDVTADEIFPVMFRVCNDDVGFRIISRLNSPDVWTSTGLRTASALDPLYNPSRYWGLIGGVWPGVTWWSAFAAARYYPQLATRGLAASFEHYAANPKTNNTVPGQFSEWFDGESLVNRGMRLSPWEPPRFLWAAVEGICGVVLQPDQLKINPLVPESWRWVALRRLPYHGREVSFFAAREGRGEGTSFRVYVTGICTTDHTLDVFDQDVTEQVRVLHPEVCHVALRRHGESVLLLGNTSGGTCIVPIELGEVLAPEATYMVHLYDSEARTWRQGDPDTGAALSTPAVSIEAGGFTVLRFVKLC